MCQFANVYAYADDIQDIKFYLSSRIGFVDYLCFKINSDFYAISQFAKDEWLSLNPAKSYVLPISNSLVHMYLRYSKIV